MFSRLLFAVILVSPLAVACSTSEEGGGTTGDDQNVTGASSEIQVEGTLRKVVELGGLSISSEVHSSSGKFVLELDDDAYRMFAEGRFAKVSGVKKMVNDVEGGGERPAIKVKKLLACPDSQINCMPPIAPTNTACGADRAWIEAKCPGASFLD